MARYVNPAPQYFTNDGKVLAGGSVEFFKSGTSSPLTTYADSLMTIPNANPLVLDGAGRLPNCFFEGSAKIQIRDAAAVLIKEVDPVGGEKQAGEFQLWDSAITYDSQSIVKGSDDKFYISLADGNVNNDPTTPSFTKWSEIRLLGVWNEFETYSTGDIVQDASGFLWRSLVNGNLGNTPATDLGTNWEPALEGAKLPEIIVLENKFVAIDKSGGGALTAQRLNRLTDGNTYDLPAANSIAASQWIDICLPDEYSASTPTVQRAGSDTITDSAGTDTSILFDAGAISIRLVSDGVNDWSLDL